MPHKNQFLIQSNVNDQNKKRCKPTKLSNITSLTGRLHQLEASADDHDKEGQRHLGSPSN